MSKAPFPSLESNRDSARKSVYEFTTKANPASLLGGIRAGQKVRFTVTTGGTAPEVTAIQAN